MIRNSLTAGLAAGALAFAGLALGASPAMAAGAKPYTGDDTVINFGAPGVGVNFLSEFLPYTGPSTTVTVSAAGAPDQVVPVSEDGTAEYTVTVPEDAPAGSTYEGVVTTSDGTVVSTFAIEVSGAPDDVEAASFVADSGDAAMIWFGAGLVALLGAGTAVGIMTRRRVTVSE